MTNDLLKMNEEQLKQLLKPKDKLVSEKTSVSISKNDYLLLKIIRQRKYFDSESSAQTLHYLIQDFIKRKHKKFLEQQRNKKNV